jgi:hypothetical protein
MAGGVPASSHRTGARSFREPRELTRETLVDVLAEKWFGEFGEQDKSPCTLRRFASAR